MIRALEIDEDLSELDKDLARQQKQRVENWRAFYDVTNEQLEKSKLPKKACTECTTMYKPAQVRQKYCSNDCTKTAYKKRVIQLREMRRQCQTNKTQ